MSYEVKAITDGKAVYVTKKISSFTWRDNTDSLGMEISFSMPHSHYDKNFTEEITCGSTIILYRNGSELIRGVVTNTSINGDEYSGYDYAWYLNKSETIYQLKNTSADKAILQLCKRFGVPIGKIPSMPTKISHMYKDIIVSDIINDILRKVKNETGKTYRMEMWRGKLNFTSLGAKKIQPQYTDRTGKKIHCMKAAEITGERNITDMRNSIIVSSTGETTKMIKESIADTASIKKYGLLQTVEVEEQITEAKARNIAKNKLRELNKVKIAFTASMPGNIEARAGRKMYFNRPEINIKGYYLIKSCEHTLKNGIHWMSCEMEG